MEREFIVRQDHTVAECMNGSECFITCSHYRDQGWTGVKTAAQEHIRDTGHSVRLIRGLTLERAELLEGVPQPQ